MKEEEVENMENERESYNRERLREKLGERD
jgi:hypothetical protein